MASSTAAGKSASSSRSSASNGRAVAEVVPSGDKGRRRRSEAVDIESVQSWIVRVETALIALTVVAIAAMDYYVGQDRSLGPLYLIPVSYCALTHRRAVAIGLFVVCVGLRQAFGPIEDMTAPWSYFARDVAIASVFVLVVAYLGRLGRRRSAFFELARRQRDDLEKEVDLAALLQKRLIALNQSPAGGLDIAVWCDLLKGVGGDYYDFVELSESRNGVVIADIAGKGLPAALLMPAVRIALRSIAERHDEPTAIVSELNAILDQTTEPSNYATLIFARLDLKNSRFTYVNAGHPPGLLVSADGEVTWLSEGGTPVGLIAEPTYESAQVQVSPGSVLVLYSDGVTEATNADDEEFGTERLARAVQSAIHEGAEGIVQAIHDAVDGFKSHPEPTDDTTVIVIKWPR